jgi:hypothetical protein
MCFIWHSSVFISIFTLFLLSLPILVHFSALFALQVPLIFCIDGTYYLFGKFYYSICRTSITSYTRLTSNHLSGNQWHPCRLHVHWRLPIAQLVFMDVSMSVDPCTHGKKYTENYLTLWQHNSAWASYSWYKWVILITTNVYFACLTLTHVHAADVYVVLTCSFNTGLVTVF